MNDSPSSLSDEALSELVFESQATIPGGNIPANDIPGRIQRFNQLYIEVAENPKVPRCSTRNLKRSGKLATTRREARCWPLAPKANAIRMAAALQSMTMK